MREAAILDRVQESKLELFQRRDGLGLISKLVLALAWAGITGLAAQIKVPLPFTPVPMTGQTLAVLLAGVLLGSSWGSLSQVLYIALGIVGIPWFAAGGSGMSYLAGPTGGYLIGFVLAAWCIGRVFDRSPRLRGFLPMLGVLVVADLGLIHLPGLVQLGLWGGISKGTAPSVLSLIQMGCLPFLLGDALKILAAAAIAQGIRAK